MRIRVTIDLDKASELISEATWEESGCYDIDDEGVCSYWYGNRINWVEFENVEIIEEAKKAITGDNNLMPIGERKK